MAGPRPKQLRDPTSTTGFVLTLQDDDSFGAEVSGSAAAGSGQLLRKTISVDFKVQATTDLYTVPSGETAVITRAVFVPTTATSVTVDAIGGIGVASGEDDIIPSGTFTGLVTDTAYSIDVFSLAVVATTGQIIKIGIDTIATATTLLVDVYLFGYLLSGVAGATTAQALPKRFIEGLVVEWASDDTVTVSAGSCRNIANDGDILLAAKTAADVTIKHSASDGLAQINGIDEKGLDNLTSGSITCSQTTNTVTTTGDISPHLGTHPVTGTITTAGTAVTGSGTLFTEEVAIGDILGSSTTYGWSQVTSVTSDTAIVLTTALPGGNATGIAATVIHNPSIQPGASVTDRVRSMDATGTSISVNTSSTEAASSPVTIGGVPSDNIAVVAWLAVWVIDDGTTSATLLSTQHEDLLALPAGYTSKRRVGWTMFGDFQGGAALMADPYYSDGSNYRFCRWGKATVEFFASSIQITENTYTPFPQHHAVFPSAGMNMPRTSVTGSFFIGQSMTTPFTAGSYRARFRIPGDTNDYASFTFLGGQSGAFENAGLIGDLATNAAQVLELHAEAPGGGQTSLSINPLGFYDTL